MRHMKSRIEIFAAITFTFLGASMMPACSSDGSSTTTQSDAASSGAGATGGAYDGRLYRAAAAGDRNVVETRLAYGRDINGVNPENGWTPLHAAAFNGHKKLVAFMLVHGANVDATTRDGDTPLHFAVRADHDDTVQALLAGSPDLSIRNSKGKTARELASPAIAALFPPSNG